ncbi:pyridoxamine 5'-phosphate oxidase family protein [Terrimonas sp. NA20]|uniref:Pyridoxamine 5'-phosphate oxidase family protein n=1 Tax=Terrimonas ginsenosidimutans TaxID=2908004 RepID=A0ABS9KXE5_9BACT|nr:pyridoxamine 5'-phosphate oxidase family protein [Terrimonas ginsenosidimutans]MCG2616899.1 pyridoxamine 5'-phosphate oxidase family protein [Terrimonas ginsenosidimutans]
MGQHKDLRNDAAIEKIREMAEEKICLFCTYENGQIVSRPMSTQQVDEDGTLWFLSRKDSSKNEQIDENSSVHLMYSDTSKHHYLSLTGHARIVIDQSKVEELWNPIAKAWFEKGKDDPEISLISVAPEEGHYWDTKNGKLVSMLKIAVAAVSGKQMDGGVEGDITV